MNINFHAPFSINEYLVNLAQEKWKKIEQLQLRYANADMYFKLKDSADSQKDKEVEIKLQVPGQVLFAHSISDAYEKAIPDAIEKMRKLVVKYKGKFEPKRG